MLWDGWSGGSNLSHGSLGWEGIVLWDGWSGGSNLSHGSLGWEGMNRVRIF